MHMLDLFQYFRKRISGVYDLSAMIDYVLWTTNQTQLAYVGHSQGVTAMFVLLSELPHYNEKVSIFHAMTSPIIFKYNHPLMPQTIEQVDTVTVKMTRFSFIRNLNRTFGVITNSLIVVGVFSEFSTFKWHS